MEWLWVGLASGAQSLEPVRGVWVPAHCAPHRHAPIIVLDEATSALDTEAELEIQRALAAVMKGRTVLAIAHRLSTVAKFDQLVVLREGHIVEQGTPAELRRRRGLFDRMCRLQEEGPMQLAS
jgi:ATP-binding cassette subfamily B protein